MLISTDRDTGEVSTFDTESDIPYTFCASSTIINLSPQFEEAGTRLNFFPCTSDDDCKDRRSCEHDGNAPCSTDGYCTCTPLASPGCSENSECEMGEVCTTGDSLESPICISALTVNAVPEFKPIDPLSTPRSEASPTPIAESEDTGGRICIDSTDLE